MTLATCRCECCRKRALEPGFFSGMLSSREEMITIRAKIKEALSEIDAACLAIKAWHPEKPPMKNLLKVMDILGEI